MHLRPTLRGRPKAGAEAHRFERVDAANRLGDQTVQLAIPVNVTAEAHGHARDPNLDDATNGVPVAFGGVNGRDHARLRVSISTAHHGGLHALPIRLAGDHRLHAAERDDMAMELDAKLLQQPSRDRARCHASGGLTCAGTLQHRPHVVESILDRPSQVGVAWTKPRDPLSRPFDGLDRHFLLPVFPVLVPNQQGDRTPQREAMADSGQDFRMILLDFHPAAAAVPELTAVKLRGDIVLAQT